jgi:hypothetical protein
LAEKAAAMQACEPNDPIFKRSDAGRTQAPFVVPTIIWLGSITRDAFSRSTVDDAPALTRDDKEQIRVIVESDFGQTTNRVNGKLSPRRQ